MVRIALFALFISGVALVMSGCTNTVRGLGRDFNSDSMQNYNSRVASDLD